MTLETSPHVPAPQPSSPRARAPTVARTARATRARRPVRIAILGINYFPEPTGIAPYTTALATGLAARGHDVRVITGCPHYPQWRRAAGAGLRSTEVIDGVPIRRLNHVVPSGKSWFGRAAMEVTFGLQIVTSRWGRPEVIVCITPTLLATSMAVTRARASWRRPAIGILVQDVYGRGALESGIRSTTVKRTLSTVESATLRAADDIAVIHRGFGSDLVDDFGVDARRIREIRNWSHVGAPDPMASAAFRTARGWSRDDVVVLHAGNMGYKQGLENVVAAADLASHMGTRVHFVLLGDGNQRAALQVAAAKLTNVEFLPPVDEVDFPAALGAADVLLVNERPGVGHMSVPSKLTSYFRAGKPVLAAIDEGGHTAWEMASSGGGVTVPAGRPDLLLGEAVRLGTDPVLAQRLGRRGRLYCEATLSEESALERYESWIMDLVASRGAGTT